ncbi:MAG: apolipoprotein N-acyltransferase [Phycisphaerae bacterium]
MAGKRQRANPSAIRAQIDAIEKPVSGMPAAAGPMRRLITCVLANALTVVLLSASFAPHNAWWLAYVALVPWALALGGTRDGWRAIGRRTSEIFKRNQPVGLILKLVTAVVRVIVSPGVLFWGLNLYWLSWVTGIGYAALVFYLWLYWLVATFILRAAMRRGWPAWLVLPITWVALEYLRAYLISGFPWFYLAHSQYQQARLIQIADLTGQYGVSFFVAMVNGLVVDLVLRLRRAARSGPAADSGQPPAAAGKGIMPGRLYLGFGLTIVTAGALLGYGTWRLGQDTTSPGPVIGLVQEAFPIALGRPTDEKKVMRAHIETSRLLAGAGCDVVIWPETMLPRYVNAEALAIDPEKMSRDELRALAYRVFGPGASRRYAEDKAEFARQGKAGDFDAVWDKTLRDALDGTLRDKPSEPPKDYWVLEARLYDRSYLPARCYAQDMARLSRELACPVLAGDNTLHRNPSPIDAADQWVVCNSSLAFDGDEAASFEYDKVHLVPFSEYVPYKRTWPWMYRLLRTPVPDVMDQLEPGTKFNSYELKRGGTTWRVATPICYEGVFDRVCRQMVVRDGKKAVDVLANMSNDGWFVWPENFWLTRLLGKNGVASTEQSQHLAQYCFRAVECRVPVVRAVNTGISASIDSNGRLVAVMSYNGRREMVAGAMLLKDKAAATKDHVAGPQILVDSRVSVYSLAGDIFALAVSAAAAAMCIGLALRRPGAEKRDT